MQPLSHAHDDEKLSDVRNLFEASEFKGLMMLITGGGIGATMPVAFITVKLPDGSLVHLDVDLKTRIEEFRSILAPKCGIKRHRQRLVFAGRLLQERTESACFYLPSEIWHPEDGRTLEAYGVDRNSTIHLLHGQQGGGDGPSGVDISQMPPQLGALQRHVLQNPDILQQMLEEPG
eukprot:s820_g9.t1